MVKITDEQRKILEPLIDNLQSLIDMDSDEELLLALDDLIIDELDDDQNNLSAKGIQLQKLYDAKVLYLFTAPVSNSIQLHIIFLPVYPMLRVPVQPHPPLSQ